MNLVKLLAVSGWLFFVLALSTLNVNAQTGIDDLFKRSAAAVASGDLAGALVPLQQILSKEPGNISAIEESSSLYSRLKNYPAAILYAKKLVSLQPDNANVYNSTGWYLLLNKEYAEAEKYLLKSLSLNNSSYSVYLNLGHVYAFLKQQPVSLEYYKKAASYIPNKEAYEQGILADFEFFEKEGTYPYKIAPYKNMFVMYFNNEYLGKTYGNKTLDTIHNFLSFRTYAADHEVIVALKERFLKEELNNIRYRLYVMRDFFWDLGWRHYHKGSKQIAIGQYFINVIKISNDLKDTSFIIDALSGVGYAEQDVSLLKQALGFAVTSNNIKKQYRINLMLGDHMQQKQQLNEAMNYFRQSLLLTGSEDRQEKSVSINRIITVFGDKNQFDSVDHYYTQIKKLRIGDKAQLEEEFINDLNYFSYLNKAGKYADAIKNGMAFIRTYKNEKAIDLSGMYEKAGNAYAALSKTDSATFYHRQSIRLYSIYVQNNLGTDHELPLKAKYASFEYLKQTALAKNDMNELFSLSELCKANILYPKLTGGITPKTIDMKGLATGLAEDEAALSYSNSFMTRLAYGIALNKTDKLLVKENYIPLDALLKKHSGVNWDDLQFKLRMKLSKEVIAEANKTINITLASIASSNLSGMMNKGKTRGVTDSDMDTIRNTAGELLAFNDILYEIYIKPFEKIIAGKKTIYISTDMGTALIPFEALKNEKGEYLGSLYNIVYVPSFTSRAILRSTLPQANKQMLALGNPVYDNFNPHNTRGRAYDISRSLISWSNLPGTGKELESIRKNVAGATIISQATLTESKLKQMSRSGELAKYEVVHFAVHGLGSTNDHRDNTLIISEHGSATEDGFLQFDEIAQLDIKARLVCLSACETVVGLPSENEEVKNLPVAFLMAGAHSVIGTWWQIDDEASGIFMAAFYNQVFKENKSYSEALQITRQKFIKGEFGETYKAPYYWAPFKYFGY